MSKIYNPLNLYKEHNNTCIIGIWVSEPNSDFFIKIKEIKKEFGKWTITGESYCVYDDRVEHIINDYTTYDKIVEKVKESTVLDYVLGTACQSRKFIERENHPSFGEKLEY